MESTYSFSSLPLADKKVIAMAIRGYFGSAWKVWLGSTMVQKKEDMVINRTSLGLPREALEQFKQLCLKKGIQLSEAEIAREAHNLINFARVVNGKAPYLDKES